MCPTQGIFGKFQRALGVVEALNKIFDKETGMCCFRSIAKLIKAKRLSHPKGYSQLNFHLLLQKWSFISNVECPCNIPLKMLRKVSEVLDIPTEDSKGFWMIMKRL